MPSRGKNLVILYEDIKDERVALRESGVDPKTLQTRIPRISHTASHDIPLKVHTADDTRC